MPRSLQFTESVSECRVSAVSVHPLTRRDRRQGFGRTLRVVLAKSPKRFGVDGSGFGISKTKASDSILTS